MLNLCIFSFSFLSFQVNRMKIAQKDRDNLTDAKEEAQQYLVLYYIILYYIFIL